MRLPSKSLVLARDGRLAITSMTLRFQKSSISMFGLLARSNLVDVSLESRLFEWYTNYAKPYFNTMEGNNTLFYNMFRPALASLLEERGQIRALDLGAGRSSFSRWLGAIDVKNRVHVTAQDVTAANRDYLIEECDEVFIGNVLDMKSQFDLIVSTFAYEHLVFPEQVLSHCLEILRPGGILYIVSPCYTLPGYVPPALRHLPRWRQYAISLFLTASSAFVRITQRPLFWIVKNPAVFSRPFRRDCDAVHMVSKADLRAHLRNHCEELSITLPEARGRGYVWLRFMLLIAAYRKRRDR